VEEIGLQGGPCGGFAMFDWFKSKTRERRKKVRLDRKHVEARARRFLESYLDADEMQKPHFYRAVQDISNMCRSVELSVRFDIDDCRIAETTSQAAMKMVMARTGRIKENDAVGNFVTDACATVAVAYNRAAGVYVGNDELQELGTAAVHLLTMATSYTSADEDGGQHV
jgi:hypothetical protein